MWDNSLLFPDLLALNLKLQYDELFFLINMIMTIGPEYSGRSRQRAGSGPITKTTCGPAAA